MFIISFIFLTLFFIYLNKFIKPNKFYILYFGFLYFLIEFILDLMNNSVVVNNNVTYITESDLQILFISLIFILTFKLFVIINILMLVLRLIKKRIKKSVFFITKNHTK